MTINELHNKFLRLTADRRIAWSRSDHNKIAELDAEIAETLDVYNQEREDRS